VHDSDNEGMRYWRNRNTEEPADRPVKTELEDPEWHQNHTFALSKEPIDRLYEKAKTKTIFLCGITPNDLDFKDRFKEIFSLTIDEDLQKNRVVNRTNHNYGKAPHQFAAALKWRGPQIAKYRQAGAHEVDASQPIDRIVEEILALTKP